MKVKRLAQQPPGGSRIGEAARAPPDASGEPRGLRAAALSRMDECAGQSKLSPRVREVLQRPASQAPSSDADHRLHAGAPSAEGECLEVMKHCHMKDSHDADLYHCASDVVARYVAAS